MTVTPLNTGETGRSQGFSAGMPDRVELKLYSALTRAARPIAPLILWWRMRHGKEDWDRLGERLGRASLIRPEGNIVWFHGASVGEVNSILPLIRRLGELRPDVSFLLTSGTVTSAEFVASRLPPRTFHQYVPLDSPRIAAAFLEYWRPALAIFTEQEIWPNLVMEACRRHVPMALVNARMSDHSFERWQRRPGLAEALFSRFSLVMAQSEVLAERFRSLGAHWAVNSGNLKFDVPPPVVDESALLALKTALDGRPVLMAASTHPGEEEIVARVHARLRERVPGLVTIIAPRHPNRGEGIAATLSGMGLSVKRRQEGHLPEPETDIYLADTIGELGTLYAVAGVAFIGGSLVPHGGQNPIEAVQHGVAVVTGPHTRNFADVLRVLKACDGVQVVKDEDELGAVLELLLMSPDDAARLRRRATGALGSMAGALTRTAEALASLLDADAAVRDLPQRAH
ncbi:MAG: 3-deoxy-D-manno-octulosonic acid transferase [Hyphomicrobiaceae bacterium]